MADKIIFVDWNDCPIMVDRYHSKCYRVLPTGIDTVEIDLSAADLNWNYPRITEEMAKEMAKRKVAQ